MQDFYKEIIKKEDLFFRNIKLGASILEVESIEGTEYLKKNGNNPSLYYSSEIGEIETIDLYFGLDTEEKVNRVKLMFYTEPDFYNEKITEEDFSTFEKKFHENNIEQSLKEPNNLLKSILNMFSNELGEPLEEHKDEVFKEIYHDFKRWIWFKEGDDIPLRLSLTSYLDDSDGQSIKWVLSLLLSENITP